MRLASVGVALAAAVCLTAPTPILAQPAAPKCDSVDLFCGQVPDLSTPEGRAQALAWIRGKPAPPPAGAGANDPPTKPGLEEDIEETPEERAALLQRSAAEREAAAKQRAVERSRRESDYLRELAAIQVEDASTLRFLSADCPNNDAPSGYCMNDVSRARKIEPRMQVFLSNREVVAMLARMHIAWRPESPMRAAAVKLPLEPKSGDKAARDYLRAHSFRASGGGFLGCADERKAVIDAGEPSQVERADSDAAFLWDPDKALHELAPIEESSQAGTAANTYRVCVLRARWAELRMQGLSPPPPAPVAAPAPGPSGSASLASSLFNQSVGQARANPQGTAAALQAQQASRASELADLTSRSVARADAMMSVVMLGVQAYVDTQLQDAVNSTVNGGSQPVLAAAAPAPFQTAAGGSESRAAPGGGAAPQRTQQPVRVDASGCIRVVDPKTVGVRSNFAHVFYNSCGYEVGIQWDGSGAAVPAGGWRGDMRPSHNTPYKVFR